jgi:signal transduction histidine kinase
MVSFVDKDHQFFKSQCGLQEPLATVRRTPLTHSFCQYVVAAASALVVSDAREHPLLRDNGAIKDLNAIAYLGIPLTTREGHTLGSFCVIDDHPRDWTEEEIDLMRDLADFVISEIELRLLAHHFQASFIHGRELELERDELVHMVVHDLRNPLSSLISGLELLKESDSLKEAHEFVGIASSCAHSLLNMVNDILDVSKSESGRLTLDLGAVHARELIEVACVMVRDLGLTHDIDVEIDAQHDLPVFNADEQKLRRVLVNLISNAIQHTPRKGRVKVSARLDAGRIRFSVSDTGKGIPAEAFGQIFEKFGSSAARQGGRVSTGLGLHFCKTAIEAHGGEIDVESELGKGTSFHFDIPIGQA